VVVVVLLLLLLLLFLLLRSVTSDDQKCEGQRDERRNDKYLLRIDAAVKIETAGLKESCCL